MIILKSFTTKRLFYNLFQTLAVLLFGLVGCVSDGDEYSYFLRSFDVEEFVTAFDVEVTYPTSAQPLFCSGETQVLYGDGDVDISMVFAVGTYPFLIV